ncbi:MAG: membrane-associated protein [Myxococcota bacterium]|jgi:membrane-associated protein
MQKIGFGEAVVWCWGGIIAGDSIIYFLGRFVGARVYSWPVLRSHFRPVKRKRFEQRFHEHGTKATFLARFFPGFRMIAFFVAGNMRFSYVKFVTLDSIGAALTVPISIYLGQKFSQNLDHVQELMHEFRLPLIIVAVLVVAIVTYLLGHTRRVKLRNLLHLRKQRSKDDAQR